MRIRTKLLAAQLPLVAALAVAIVVGSIVTRALGRGSADILKDNYRSVLAAERMKEAAERIDSGVMFAVAGRPADGGAQIDTNMPLFSARARARRRTTSPSPVSARRPTRLRATWTTYSRDIAAVRPVLASANLPVRYFSALLPEFLAVKDAADAILAMNQDAMIRKSDSAQRLSGTSNTLLITVSVLGLVLAVVASSVITSRVLRPLGVVAATARRLGEGDLAVRAQVTGRDEVGELARELNTMADHVERYRKSSLGELLEAQLAAQATIDSLPDAVLVIGLDGALRHANQAAEALLKVKPELRRTRSSRSSPSCAPSSRSCASTSRVATARTCRRGSKRRSSSATVDGDARVVAARGAALRRGGRRGRRDDRAAGRDAAAPVRGAAQRSGRDRRARAAHAAHLAAHGGAPARRGARRAADAQASGSGVRGARGLRSAAVDRRRAARICRGSRPIASSCARPSSIPSS